MRVLLYLASGQYRPEYEDLNFDKIILVDRVMRLDANKPKNSKVELIKGDALFAIQTLKRRKKLEIDCLVSVNEGLSEGGGDYAIFSEFLLGYLSPILSDELLVITDIDYYNAYRIGKRVARMNWGFESNRVSPDNPMYIDPKNFTTSDKSNIPNYGDVFFLKRKRSQQSLSLNPDLEINLIHGSIWEDENQLDLIGFKLRPRESTYKVGIFFTKMKKTYNANNKTMEEILDHAEKKKIEHLGLTPWMDDDYEHVMDVLDALKKYVPKSLKKISFYLLDKKDFEMISLIQNEIILN